MKKHLTFMFFLLLGLFFLAANSFAESCSDWVVSTKEYNTDPNAFISTTFECVFEDISNVGYCKVGYPSASFCLETENNFKKEAVRARYYLSDVICDSFCDVDPAECGDLRHELWEPGSCAATKDVKHGQKIAITAAARVVDEDFSTVYCREWTDGFIAHSSENAIWYSFKRCCPFGYKYALDEGGRPYCKPICEGSLSLSTTGCDSCTITASMTASEACLGKSWELIGEVDGSFVERMCGGFVDKTSWTCSFSQSAGTRRYKFEIGIPVVYSEIKSADCSKCAVDCTNAGGFCIDDCRVCDDYCANKGGTKSCTAGYSECTGIDIYCCICGTSGGGGTPSCEPMCLPWSLVGCGVGGCASNSMYQVRSCRRSDCSWYDEVTCAQHSLCCEPRRANITITPSQQTGSPGDTLNYTVTVKNNDIACPAKDFDLWVPNCPSGWSCTLDSSKLTISSGSSASTVLRVKSSSTAELRDWNIQVMATSMLHAKFNFTDDSYVDEEYPWANFGSAENLNVGTVCYPGQESPGEQAPSICMSKYGFLKFRIPQEIEYPVLYLYKITQDWVRVDTTTVRKVADITWKESTITWDNKPEMGDAIGNLEGGYYGWGSLNLTSYFGRNSGYTQENASIGLENPYDPYDFASKENANSSIRPVILNFYGYGVSASAIYSLVDNPPQYFNQNQNASKIPPHESIKLSVLWRDDVNLSSAILATNETGIWQNKTTYGSPLLLSGKEAWSNFTWQNSSVPIGSIIGWRVYANDSKNQWNVTEITVFAGTFKIINVSTFVSISPISVKKGDKVNVTVGFIDERFVPPKNVSINLAIHNGTDYITWAECLNVNVSCQEGINNLCNPEAVAKGCKVYNSTAGNFSVRAECTIPDWVPYGARKLRALITYYSTPVTLKADAEIYVQGETVQVITPLQKFLIFVRMILKGITGLFIFPLT
jgi:hypothetical protein